MQWDSLPLRRHCLDGTRSLRRTCPPQKGRRSRTVPAIRRRVHGVASEDFADDLCTPLYLAPWVGRNRGSRSAAIQSSSRQGIAAFGRSSSRRAVSNYCVQLGSGAFAGISGAVVNVGLLGLQLASSDPDSLTWGCDVANSPTPSGKAGGLIDAPLANVRRSEFSATRVRFVLDAQDGGTLLSEYAEALGGITTGDSPGSGVVLGNRFV